MPLVLVLVGMYRRIRVQGRELRRETWCFLPRVQSPVNDDVVVWLCERVRARTTLYKRERERERMEVERAEVGGSAWSERLPADLLEKIVCMSGDARAIGFAALQCSMVCRSWRETLVATRRARWMAAIELRHVREEQRQCEKMQQRRKVAKGSTKVLAQSRSAPLLGMETTRLPKLVLAACRVGNPSALALAAEWLQTAGDIHLALRTWRRAARLGSAVAQVWLGELIIEGDIEYLLESHTAHSRTSSGSTSHRLYAADGPLPSHNAVASTEDIRSAIASMLRGGRNTSDSIGDDDDDDTKPSGGGDGGYSAGDKCMSVLEKMKMLKKERDMRVSGALDAQCVEELQDTTQAVLYLQKAVRNTSAERHDIAVAATLLGFSHLDGPTSSNSTAVQWFKVAAENGSVTAEETLGWMYNTGQFGD